MTDRQRLAALNRALASLKKTKKGYDPSAPNWKPALAEINSVRADLAKPAVPNLGPVLEGAVSILQSSPTHDTDGVPNHPAFDAGFGQAGRWVIAPEKMTVTEQSGAIGGDAFYAVGVSKIEYWFGHIGISPATGRVFAKGERLARIADQANTDHVHVGMDVRPLTGKSLLYGRDGNGPDYTWGSPTIGEQLAKELA